MRWQNSFKSQRQFLRAAKKDPLTVFVSRPWKGRETSVSLLGAVDLDSDVRVVGPNNRWMVGVEPVGKKLRLTPFRLHARP